MNVTAERILAYVALGWLIGAWLLLVGSVRRARALADALAARHPEKYEALGRPRPGYFDSIRRDRFARFVGRREFQQLGDPPLIAEFEAHRKAETRLMIFILSTLAVIALLMLAVRQAP